MAKSSTSYHPKLTDDDIRLIQELKRERQYHRDQARALIDKEIAKKFHVHHMTISRIGF